MRKWIIKSTCFNTRHTYDPEKNRILIDINYKFDNLFLTNQHFLLLIFYKIDVSPNAILILLLGRKKIIMFIQPLRLRLHYLHLSGSNG